MRHSHTSSSMPYYAVLCVVVVSLSFIIGFWLGQESILNKVSSEALQFSKQSHILRPLTNSNTSNNAAVKQVNENGESNQFSSLSSTPNSTSLQHSSSLDDSDFELSDNAGPIDVLKLLVAITTSDNPSHMDMFSSTMDRLRKQISDNPDNIEILLTHFIESPSDSREPYYITSVLQSADIANRDTIMNDLVQRLATIGSSQANEKMLQLISNTGLANKQPEVIEAVTNVALYSDSSDPNKLFALDLLMPYQLDLSQKQKVVDDLRFALDNSSDDDKSYLVESMMRYSDKPQRQQLASTFLQTETDFATRVATLSSFHSGVLQANDKLKAQLFSIALSDTDPLKEHAKHALMYAFEINNDEYQQLSGNTQ